MGFRYYNLNQMSVISEVKQRIDIVEIVSEYVSLQKAGHNFKGLCPFHSERYPSFFVFPEQQTWHCFGACGTGGDVFSFVMKKNNSDFGQVLHLLAQRAGVVLTSPGIPSKSEDKDKERLLHINEAATEYYHHVLLTAKTGEAARSYLARRKVMLETIKEFHLGFSPDSWDTAKNYLMNKGYEEGELVNVGLTIEREGGGSYDRFRNRLMFPIYDILGRVIGFGARALDDSLPKYINSPQTLVFDKSGNLYGVHKAISAIRKENLIIVMEGYMDVLTAHQHGWQNVVASMGTSLTEKQAGIIKKLTKNVMLALDADAAGKEATLRGIDVLFHSLEKRGTEMLPYSKESARSMHKGEEPSPLLAQAVKLQSTIDAEISVLRLPPGTDPDEIISENTALWQNLVEQAVPVLDFAFQTVLSKVDTNKAKDKSLAVEKLLPLIYEIKAPIQRSHYLRKLARELKIEESDIKDALSKLKTNHKRPQSSEPAEQSRLARQLVSSPVEEYCLALLLQYPELRKLTQELQPEHFQHTENRELFIQWQGCQDIVHLQGKFDVTLSEHLYYLLDKPFLPSVQESEKERGLILRDCVLRLQERLSRTLEMEKKLTLEITREEEGASAELTRLEREGIDSSRQLREIFIRKQRKQ